MGNVETLAQLLVRVARDSLLKMRNKKGEQGRQLVEFIVFSGSYQIP